jgi:hypothetical protein
MVLNKYKDHIPPEAIYIGRGSIWGNPFPMSKEVSREECLSRYKVWVKDQILQGNYTLEQLASLYNMDLVCYCSPKPCHGHVLEKLANWAYHKLQQNKS